MRIFVAGHRGMVGSAIVRHLSNRNDVNLITASRGELDLLDQRGVYDFLEKLKPDIVIDAAARVGGILANYNHPYTFLMENMIMQNNLIDASVKLKINKFIFLGSSCIYPKMAQQPLLEEYLLTAPLEPTNEWYAIAKISGVKACEAVRKDHGLDFVSLMPTNLYGPNDNFDLNTSHVLPAMIRKFHEAKLQDDATVTLWGSGTPMREFLHVDDLASAVAFVVDEKLPSHLYNVGYGKDLRIDDLAKIIQSAIGHKGDIVWDTDKPDGTPRKWMDSSKLLTLGWKPKVSLENGIAETYKWFLKNISDFKEVKL